MNRLKEFREKRGLTQSEIAEKLGITYQAYAHYEKGRRQPDPEQLKVLADFYKVSIDELVGREQINADELSAGWSDTKKINVTPDEEDVLIAYRVIKKKFDNKMNKSILMLLTAMAEGK